MSAQAQISTRKYYLDMLRIAAMAGVIMIHVVSQNWHAVSANSMSWKVFNVAGSFSRWSVPVFVMISGALFLDPAKTLTLKSLLKKNVVRIIGVLLFWSALYAALFSHDSVKSFLKALVFGYYHLWFLYMLIGLYLVTPFLRKIAADPIIEKYFLALALVFAFIIPTIQEIVHSGALERFINMLHIDMVLGYTGYFVLGHYLDQAVIKKSKRILIYTLGLLAVVAVIAGNAYMAIVYNTKVENFFEFISLWTLPVSIAVFVWAKQFATVHPIKHEKQLLALSQASLGVYLVHPLIMSLLGHVGLHSLSFSPIFSVVALFVAATVLSVIVSLILCKIPWVNKHLV